MTWGLGGIALLLGHALAGLIPLSVDALQQLPWTTAQYVFAFTWLVFMGYAEGYKGFQQRFAPRVVARAWHLAAHPRWHHLLLAPAFCIGFFHGTRRRLISSWAITLGIVLIVWAVRHVSQPWRGIIDLGVVLGLGWGLAATLGHAALAAWRGGTEVDPQLPEAS